MREHDDLVDEELLVHLVKQASLDAIVHARSEQDVGGQFLLLHHPAPLGAQRLRLPVGEHGRVGVGVVHSAVGMHRGPQARQGIGDALQNLRNLALIGVEHLAQHEEEHVLLLLEVLVDEADAHVGAQRDVAHRGDIVAPLTEELCGGAHDLRAPLVDELPVGDGAYDLERHHYSQNLGILHSPLGGGLA